MWGRARGGAPGPRLYPGAPGAPHSCHSNLGVLTTQELSYFPWPSLLFFQRRWRAITAPQPLHPVILGKSSRSFSLLLKIFHLTKPGERSAHSFRSPFYR